MRIVSFNIRFGGHGREQYIAQSLQSAHPDIIVLEEATDPLTVKTIADQLNAPYYGAHPSYSVAFISYVPISHHQWHSHKQLRTPILEIELEDNFRIFGVHLTSLLTYRREQIRVQ